MTENGAVSAGDIDRLVEASTRLATASEGFAQAMVAHQERARTATRRYRVTLLLIVLGFSGLYVRQEIANTASQDARHTIIDCVDPSGECAQQGAQQTAAVIAQLNRYAVLAAVCGPRFVTLSITEAVDATQRCIEQGAK